MHTTIAAIEYVRMKHQHVMADAPRADQAGGAEEAAALRGRALHREQHRADQLPARRCPGRKPPFLAVKRPARPYKSPHTKPIFIGKC
jgi:hypothetical protein